MADLFDNMDEINKLLEELDEGDSSANGDTAEWTMEDIDRLIAETGDEDESETIEMQDSNLTKEYENILSNEFDSDLFTIQPISSDVSDAEMLDISSESDEVEGQETFYGEEDFNIDLFEIETFEISEDDDTITKIPQEEITYTHRMPEEYTDISSSSALEEPVSDETSNAQPEEDKKEEVSAEKAAEEDTSDSEDENKVIDYRTRFFQRFTIEEPKEEEPEPEGPIEKSGIVLCKDENGVTDGDLDSVPTVLAAEDFSKFSEEKTRIDVSSAKKEEKEQTDDRVEGQMVLNGFVDVTSDSLPEITAERDIEEGLNVRRKEKAKEFKLEDIDDGDFNEEFDEIDKKEAEENIQEEPEEEGVKSFPGEYTDEAQKHTVHKRLIERFEKSKRSVMYIGAIELVLVLMAFMPAIGRLLQLESSLFQSGSTVICIAQALLTSASIVFYDRFSSTISDLAKKRITADTAVILAIVVSLSHNVISAISGSRYPVFAAAAVFGVFISALTNMVDAKRILDNFDLCVFRYGHNMYAVHRFENESEIFELGRGLLMGNAEMLYSSSVVFPSNFMEKSNSKDDSKDYSPLMITAAVVGSIVAAVVLGIRNKSAVDALTAFAGAFCISIPVFTRIVPAFLVYIVNHHLNKEGSMIINLDAAKKTAASNAIVVDSADIFDQSKCVMHGMKEFKTMRTDVILLYAAAMVIKSGGPLKECFEHVVDSRADLLPSVRELVYEDKMGISARIDERKVLLGNRNMMIQHNIEAPDRSMEQKYTHDGRKVIYLACNGTLAAMFVVSYNVDGKIKNYLKQLGRNGIQTLVRTNDVNVTEELISEHFNITSANFRLLSSVAGRLFKRRKDTVSESFPVEVVHDGTAWSMLKSIATSCSMVLKMKIATILQFILTAFGIAVTVLVGLNGEAGLTGAAAFLILLAESLVLGGILSLRKKDPNDEKKS